MKQEIQRSHAYDQFQMAGIITIGVVLVVVTFLVLRGARTILGLDMTTFGWIVRVGVVLLTVGAVLISRGNLNNVRYVFSEGRLIVTRYWLGQKKSEKIITIDPQSVKMVSLKQSLLEKMLHAGTVVVEVDNRSNRDIYKLEHINNPRQVLHEFESYLRLPS